MKVLWYTFRGCGYLPEVGEHPGTASLAIFTLAGFAAGLQRGSILWATVGGAYILALLGPIYLYGAYDRSVLNEKLQSRKEPHE